MDINIIEIPDGLRIPKGDWVCVPYRSMMHDDQYFENALHFDGFRFLKPNLECSIAPQGDSKSTDASDGWLVWGAGRILW